MFKKIIITVLILLAGINVQAQRKVPTQIRGLENLSTGFPIHSLFSKDKVNLELANSEQLEGLQNYQLLDIDIQVINELLRIKPNTLKLLIPYKGTSYALKLFKVDFKSSAFKVITSSGTEVTDYGNQAHYRGIIENDYSSLVSISIFENEISGFISTEKHQMELGALKKNNSLKHILYPTSELKASKHTCATIDDVDSLPHVKSAPSGLRRSSVSDDCVKLYLEIDYDIYNQYTPNKLTKTQNYANGLFAQASTLFCNDGINVVLHKLKIWDTQDPYTGSNLATIYQQFTSNLNGNYDGTIAHLIGLNGGGGLARVGLGSVFCRKTINTGVSGLGNTNYSVVPTYSNAVEIFTHEIGHNLGSPHTHACVWNGNNTPIDGCGIQAGYPENNCNTPATIPASGTIMSYCHLVANSGINFNNGFGPQPTALILSNLAEQNCVYSCADGCDENKITIDITHKLNKNFVMGYRGIHEPQFVDGVNASNNFNTNSITYELCIADDCYNFQFQEYETVTIKDNNGNVIYSVTKDPLVAVQFADTWMCFPECVVPMTEKSTPITGTVYSRLATADFDQDGDLDIAVSGVTCSNFLNCAITEIYQNDGNANFTKMNVDMEGLWLGDMKWGKINNDNYMDLMTIGGTSSGKAYVYYYNPTTSTFDKQLATGVTASLKATLDLGDVNGDGYDDMIVGGSNPSNSFLPSPTKLYINDKNGGFNVLAGTDFPSFVEGDIKFANIGGDDRLEIIISGGPSITNHAYAGAVYSDTGTGTLPEYKLTYDLPLLSYSKISLGHIRANFSAVQAVITGKPKGSNKVMMYYFRVNPTDIDTDNNGAPNFTDNPIDSFWFNGGQGVSTRIADFDYLDAGNIFTTGESANPLRKSDSRIYFYFTEERSVVFPCTDLRQSYLDAINVGDFDGDNKIDIITTGGKIVTSGAINGNIGNPTTQLFLNNYSGQNLPPAAPWELYYSFTYNPDLVVDSASTLEWGLGSDDHTEVSLLNYNVRIGTTPGGDDVLYPKAGADGKLHQLTMGNSNGTRTLDLNKLDLEVGKTYYAAVQSIDLSYVGSPWSEEVSFVFGEENSTKVIRTKPIEILKLYPNPSHGNITLENQGRQALTVQILDIAGKKVKTIDVGMDSKAIIDTNTLSAGVYFATTNLGQRIRFIVY